MKQYKAGTKPLMAVTNECRRGEAQFGLWGCVEKGQARYENQNDRELDDSARQRVVGCRT